MSITFSKGSGLNNSVYGASYEPIKMMIEKKAEAFENKSIIPHIFCMDRSENFAEKITSVTSMDGFSPVDEGGAFPVDSWQEGFSKTLTHMTFKDQFTITEEMVDDAKTIDLKRKPAAFVQGYYRMREQFGSALLTNGTSSSVSFRGKKLDTTAADGLSLFNTAHKSITKSDTQSNLFSDAFSAETLAKLETAMQNFTDDNGNILGVTPDTIIIPNDATIKQSVFSVIGADKDPSTSNNGFNYLYGRWTVIIDPYWILDSDRTNTPFILMSKTYNEDSIGGIWFDRKPLQVEADKDPNTWNMVWRGRARFSAGFNDWRAFAMAGYDDADDTL